MKKIVKRIFCVLLGLCLSSMAEAQLVLTLKEALTIAQEQSPDIATSKLNLERSQRLLEAQNASLKSRFSFNLTPIDFSRQRRFIDEFSVWSTNENTASFGSFNVSQPIKFTDATLNLSNRLSWQNASNTFRESSLRTFSNNFNISLTQPLFTYNRTKLRLKELNLDLENTQLAYTIQSLNLESDVTQKFYAVYQAQVALDIANEEYENKKLSFEITKNKVDADLLPREELYQQDINLANSRSALNNKEVTLENVKDGFKQALGVSLYEGIEVLYEVSFQPILVNMDFAVKHALEKRNEIRQRKINIEQSQFSLIKTRSQNEFRGDLTLSTGLFGDNASLNDIYDSPTQNPRVSLSLTIPIWDWGAKKARLAADYATVKTREISLDQQKNNIIKSIRETFRRVQNLENQVAIAEKNVRNAQLTYEINLERYRNGDLTSFQLNDFQTQLSSTKNALSNAQIDYKLSLLSLKIQTLWDFEKNESLVP